MGVYSLCRTIDICITYIGDRIPAVDKTKQSAFSRAVLTKCPAVGLEKLVVWWFSIGVGSRVYFLYRIRGFTPLG